MTAAYFLSPSGRAPAQGGAASRLPSALAEYDAAQAETDLVDSEALVPAQGTPLESAAA